MYIKIQPCELHVCRELLQWVCGKCVTMEVCRGLQGFLACIVSYTQSSPNSGIEVMDINLHKII